MLNTVLNTLASSNYWADKYAREATEKQTNTIEGVGTAIVVVLVILVIVIIIIALAKATSRANDRLEDNDLKRQLADLAEQNRRLSDKIEQLEQEKKGHR